MKDTEKIDDFAGKLSEISSKSDALGKNIEESKLVKKFLKCLPRSKYIHIVASLEQVLDLKTTSFEDIIGRLKAYEERITEEEEPQEDEGNLMYANNDTELTQFTSNDGGYRGRGRGGRNNNRGRGRGRSNEARELSESNEARDLSEIQCFRCDQYGHVAYNCPDRLLKLQEAQEHKYDDTQKADMLMMHEVVYLNERNVELNKVEAYSDGECVENGQVEVEHVPGNEKKTTCDFKLKGEIVGVSLKEV